jgi:PAS domain S-box-containing protein
MNEAITAVGDKAWIMVGLILCVLVILAVRNYWLARKLNSMVRSNEQAKTKQAHLFQARETLRSSVLESIDDQVYLLDPIGRFLDFSQHQDMPTLEVGAVDYVGKPYEDILPEEVSQLLGETITQVNATATASQFEYDLTAEGVKRTFSAKVSQSLDGKGELLGFTIVIRDMSDEAEKERQLRHLQQLDSIGKLAGGIAHDFNNLLGGIIGAADILLLEVKGDKEKEPVVGLILETAKGAVDLTQQLLDFSRKGQGETEKFSVNKIVASTISLLRHSFDDEIEIQFEYGEGDDMVEGNPLQIQNALVNLGVNARDAMPGGGVIRFETLVLESEQGRPERQIQIRVSDTGTGIPEEIRDEIFEPFFTTKAAGKGTGLGLLAVYGAVMEHKGELECESEAGKGAVFIMRLPLVA